MCWNINVSDAAENNIGYNSSASDNDPASWHQRLVKFLIRLTKYLFCSASFSSDAWQYTRKRKYD